RDRVDVLEAPLLHCHVGRTLLTGVEQVERRLSTQRLHVAAEALGGVRVTEGHGLLLGASPTEAEAYAIGDRPVLVRAALDARHDDLQKRVPMGTPLPH